MNIDPHDIRFWALDFAVRHKTREENADNVVNSAKKYLAFLQSNLDAYTDNRRPEDVGE